MAEARGRGAGMDLVVGHEFIESALRLNPNSFEAQLCAGYLDIAGQKYADAIRHFEIAMALDPFAYRPVGMIVQAYAGVGDKQKADAAARVLVTCCEKLLAVEPDHGGALGFMVPALAQLGEVDRAREWARRAVLFDPDNVRLLYNLACGMARMNDPEAACDLLEGVLNK